jgi:Bacteriocin-protection, YdeI or OmpD-Associated/Domain of unknown function (DUF1905)
MTAYLTFEARVEPMVWGRATYTILRLPAEVVSALGKTRRVEGEIAEHPVNLALTRAPVIEGIFVWAGESLLARIGIAPGDTVEVRLRPAPDDRVDLAEDVATALHVADRTEAWEALTPGKRRAALYSVDSAKTAATRAKRLARMIAELP